MVSLGGRKVLFFNAEGTVVRAVALPDLLFPFPHGFLPLANGDYVIAYVRVKPETLEFSSYGVGLFGPDFSRRRELKAYPVPAEDELKTPFIDFPLVAVSRTSFFLTSMASSREIEVYDLSGRLIRKILADYPAIDVPHGFREASIRSPRTTRSGGTSPSQEHSRRSWPSWQTIMTGSVPSDTGKTRRQAPASATCSRRAAFASSEQPWAIRGSSSGHPCGTSLSRTTASIASGRSPAASLRSWPFRYNGRLTDPGAFFPFRSISS